MALHFTSIKDYFKPIEGKNLYNPLRSIGIFMPSTSGKEDTSKTRSDISLECNGKSTDTDLCEKPASIDNITNDESKISKDVKIFGIYELDELERMCVESNLKFNHDPCHLVELKALRDQDEDSTDEGEYEVEEIIKYKNINGILEYRVKWKGWSSHYNTWEQLSNLNNCLDIVEQFHKAHKLDPLGNKRKLESAEDIRKQKKAKIDKLISDLEKREDLGSLLHLRGISFSDSTAQGLTLKKLAKETRQIIRSEKIKRGSYINQLICTKNGLFDGFLSYVEKRKESLRKLKEWELSINHLPGLQAPVKIENDVDLEGPPEQFTYITDYKAANGIIIPDDPPVGCECQDCYNMRKLCCASQSGSGFAYSRFSTVNVKPGTPIYECNKRCSCNADCLNRVVQKGRQIKLTIYRTDNGCGWGVKTQEKIKKGAFVMEYVGEVITNEEADERGKVYDAVGRTYLFDLDYDDSDCLYTVDAAFYGNVAHFMNHSCDPNLVVYAVWINNLDPKLPRLAFFAKRDIKRGEDLNFDYTMSTSGHLTEASYRSPSSSKMKDKSHSIICKCGAAICKGNVF